MIHVAAQYFLNHRLDRDEVARQTREIAAGGYQAVVAHARPGMLTPFASEAWWQAIDAVVAGCRETGMEMWIWDEDYFPSGTAGGRITWEDPGLYARAVLTHVHDVSSDGGGIELDFAAAQLLTATAYPRLADGSLGEPVDLRPYCGTRRQEWGERYVIHAAYTAQVDAVGPPHWRTSFRENRYALVWTPPTPGDWRIVVTQAQTCVGDRPDIMDPAATRRFIELTYEPYAERYGDDLGDLIGGVFTDEPNPGGMCFPWSRHLPAAFEADHGYPISQAMPHLACDISAHSPGIRWQYRQTQGRLTQAAFTGQLADWCRAHDLLFAGHLTRAEWLSVVAIWWPNELRVYADLDIPCCDPLGAAIAWPSTAAYHTGLKVVSSAAHLHAKPGAGSDALAVIGDEAGLRDMKHHLDFHMVLGLTWFNLHGLHYSLDGPRKDEVPPSLFEQHSEWPYMHRLFDDVAATCAALTGGTHHCRIAVLYPSTGLGAQITDHTNDWFCLPDEDAVHALSEALLSHQRDFDFIDETTLQETVSANGDWRTPEPYEILILAAQRYIEAESADAIAALHDAGRRIIVIGPTPRLIARRGSEPVSDWAAPAGLERIDEPSADWLASLPGPTLTGEGNRDVFLLQRMDADGCELTFAVNRREAAFDGELDGMPLWLAPRGSALIRDGAGTTPPLAGAEPVADLTRDWALRIQANQLPLATWHVERQPAPVFYGRPLTFNLLQREDAPEPQTADGPRQFYTRFFLIGEPSDVMLLMEQSAVTGDGDWRVLVNGVEAPLSPARVWDCLNLTADITPLLHIGSTATLNVITVETDGGALAEMPHLLGRFRAEFRHGHPSLPYLTADRCELALDSLQDWAGLGFPTYSGIGSYSRSFSCDAAGDYRLDLGRVDDVAEVLVDGESVAVCAWAPYIVSLAGLSAGEHRLEIRVCNAPGNRYRMSAMPAGLTGPVRLHRVV